MKNLYVYTLNSDKVEVKEVYNVIVKREGDIIRKTDDYAYKNKGRYSVFHRSKLDLDKFVYHEFFQRKTEKDVAYIEYISFEPVTNLVQLKADMINFLEKTIQELIDKNNKFIDREIACFIDRQEKLRKEYINRKLTLKEETLARFNEK